MIGAFKSRTRVSMEGFASNLIRELRWARKELRELVSMGVEIDGDPSELDGSIYMLQCLVDSVRKLRNIGAGALVEFADFWSLATIAPRDDRQAKTADWCAAAFGEAHASSVPQRAVRFLEEAVELSQACGVDRAMAHQLVDYIFDRPPGEPFQELGGVGVTTLALANALGVSADQAEAAEVARVLAKPLKHFADRNAAKNAAGFDVTQGGQDGFQA
jgi:hypothetical protein